MLFSFLVSSEKQNESLYLLKLLVKTFALPVEASS